MVGISKDSVESHRRFAAKHGLRCHLLADPDGTILKKLGILGPLGLPRRCTFVVDRAGIVRHVFENVSIPGHADEVLRKVQAL